MSTAAERAAAARRLAAILATAPDLPPVRIGEVLRVHPRRTVARAAYGGRPAVIKHFAGEGAGRIVRAMAAELETVAAGMAGTDCRIMGVLRALPDLGLVVLEEVPGERFDRVLAATPDRAALVAHAGRWLEAYAGPRRSPSRFGPQHWIGRLAARRAEAATAEAQEAAAAVIARLRRLAPALAGAPVTRAAIHGDWAPLNAHYHEGVLYGVDVQGEARMALVRDAARFLVSCQVFPERPPAPGTWGVSEADRAAFLSGMTLTESDRDAILPFFLGEQLALRAINGADHPVRGPNALAAIAAWLDGTAA